MFPIYVPLSSSNPRNLPTEAPISARIMAMSCKVMSSIPGGMGSSIAHNLYNSYNPQGKEIQWLTEEDGLELYPVDI